MCVKLAAKVIFFFFYSECYTMNVNRFQNSFLYGRTNLGIGAIADVVNFFVEVNKIREKFDKI